MGNRTAAASVPRRSLLRGALGLAGLGALGLAGLSGLSGCGRKSPKPLPDQLDAFIASTAALADRYEASIGAVPELAETLTAIRDAHRQHVDALIAATAGEPVAPGAGGQRSDVAQLLEAEKAARDEAVAACLSASGRVAPLLGAIAAARAAHVEVLS